MPNLLAHNLQVLVRVFGIQRHSATRRGRKHGAAVSGSQVSHLNARIFADHFELLLRKSFETEHSAVPPQSGDELPQVLFVNIFLLRGSAVID